MNTRRAFLRRSTAAMASVGSLSLAGCLGPDGAEDVEAAFDLLDENLQVLEEFDDLEADEHPSSAEIDGIRERADEAETHLEEADAVADDEDVRAAIDQGYTLVTFQREMVHFLEALIESDIGLDTFDAHFDTGQYEDAADAAATYRTDVEEANQALSGAIEALEDVDDDVLEDEEEIELRVSRAELEAIDAELDVLYEMGHALETLARGMVSFEAGLDALEDEDLGAASEQVEDAQEEFGAVVHRFDRLQNDPDLPAHMEPDLIEMNAAATSLRDAVDHYQDALEAADRGDWEAFDEHIAAMEEALEGL